MKNPGKPTKIGAFFMRSNPSPELRIQRPFFEDDFGKLRPESGSNWKVCKS